MFARAGRLRAVSMDMGPGYAKSVREHAPRAIVCVDPYHVVQLANQVLIKRLLSRLARSHLEPFVRLGKTIRKHRDGILAAIRLGINQGRTEALNNKVRLLARRAYGFHSAKAALALVLLTCGPITLHLPHELHALGIG